MIRWTAGHEHCHRCGALTLCLVRWTGTWPVRKRALCAECLPVDGPS